MRISPKLLATLPVLFFLLTGAQNLYANSTTFTFSFADTATNGTVISAGGSLMATLVSGNEFVVTSISGMQNGFAMTLLPPGAFDSNDNKVFSSGPFLDLGGVSFVSNGVDYNIYYNAATNSYFECNSNTNGNACSPGQGLPITGNLTEVATVPEPGTLMLMGSGLIGLAGMARRKLFS